ncbi:PA3496 family putative envelope integrity protein [Pseudomonas syringae]
MEFRRAIESYSEERKLNQALSDFDDSISGHFWQASNASEGVRRNARQAG